MAFFILSTSKIILMRFCTGLGSLDLVPGFTVNFFTASSSCRENQEETQLNNPSKAVVVSSGRERIECHQKVKKKKATCKRFGISCQEEDVEYGQDETACAPQILSAAPDSYSRHRRSIQFCTGRPAGTRTASHTWVAGALCLGTCPVPIHAQRESAGTYEGKPWSQGTLD